MPQNQHWLWGIDSGDGLVAHMWQANTQSSVLQKYTAPYGVTVRKWAATSQSVVNSIWRFNVTVRNVCFGPAINGPTIFYYPLQRIWINVLDFLNGNLSCDILTRTTSETQACNSFVLQGRAHILPEWPVCGISAPGLYVWNGVSGTNYKRVRGEDKKCPWWSSYCHVSLLWWWMWIHPVYTFYKELSNECLYYPNKSLWATALNIFINTTMKVFI